MIDLKSCSDIFSDYIKAGSQSSSPEVLEELADSKFDRIRLRVAENVKSPINVLEKLSRDNNSDVRIAVGTNPAAPLAVCLPLALDGDPNVRLGLANDLSTPVELLDKLVEDANPYICCRAKQTKDLILSKQDKPSFGQEMARWANSIMEDSTELRYA